MLSIGNRIRLIDAMQPNQKPPSKGVVFDFCKIDIFLIKDKNRSSSTNRSEYERTPDTAPFISVVLHRPIGHNCYHSEKSSRPRARKTRASTTKQVGSAHISSLLHNLLFGLAGRKILCAKQPQWDGKSKQRRWVTKIGLTLELGLFSYIAISQTPATQANSFFTSVSSCFS